MIGCVEVNDSFLDIRDFLAGFGLLGRTGSERSHDLTENGC